MPDQTYIYDVFISHAPADAPWVRHELIPRLAAAGLRHALNDQPGVLHPGRLEPVEALIRQSRRVVLVLSPDYLADRMADYENLVAQTLDFQERTFRVLPVWVHPADEAQLPTRLAMLGSARLFDPEQRERGFAQLIDVLGQPLAVWE
jgi:hypothetical protein